MHVSPVHAKIPFVILIKHKRANHLSSPVVELSVEGIFFITELLPLADIV